MSPQGWMARGLVSRLHWDSGTTRPSLVLQYTCRIILPCPQPPLHCNHSRTSAPGDAALIHPTAGTESPQVQLHSQNPPSPNFRGIFGAGLRTARGKLSGTFLQPAEILS